MTRRSAFCFCTHSRTRTAAHANDVDCGLRCPWMWTWTWTAPTRPPRRRPLLLWLCQAARASREMRLAISVTGEGAGGAGLVRPPAYISGCGLWSSRSGRMVDGSVRRQSLIRMGASAWRGDETAGHLCPYTSTVPAADGFLFLLSPPATPSPHRMNRSPQRLVRGLVGSTTRSGRPRTSSRAVAFVAERPAGP